jgi:tripartite-type tricarboxylate transporter receptor subunit TctC
VLDPSILKTERPPRHVISAGTPPSPRLARSALPRERVRSLNDLIGKQIDLGCEQATTATEPVKGKLVKAYAVTTKTRLASLPELPTADEAGLNGFEVNVWHGILAPKDTPAAVVQKLSAALKAAVKDPEVMKRFSDINTVPVSEDRATPEALGKLLISEIERWEPVIKAANQFAD